MAKSRARLAAIGKRSHLSDMNFELTDEQAPALLKELDNIIDGDRFQILRARPNVWCGRWRQ
jgi:hypothetical protein